MKHVRFWVGMVVMALAGCGAQPMTPKGKPPAIQSIHLEARDVQVGSGIRLKSHVLSENGNLIFYWKATDGLIVNPREVTTIWIAPSKIPYVPYPITLTLEVKDEYGRQVERHEQIMVYPQGLLPR